MNLFYPSRNSAVGLRIPSLYKSKKRWQKAQTTFYVFILVGILLVFLAKISQLVSGALYNGLCVAVIILAGLATLLLFSFQKSKDN
jgi:DMSO/TMAO reductase YedYZ heme-binding membrane subunit